MRSISFISLAAMISIFLALIYIVINDAMTFSQVENKEPLQLVNWTGVPYYFGTAMFMFEGNAVALEIYHQMENKTKFTSSMTIAIAITVCSILTIAFFSYYCYGIKTEAVVLLNLEPNVLAFIV